MPTESRQRPYRKRRRAEQEQATRQRITEAAVRLHGSVGPARTTVSAVAREAGVQRATVYRHFPTEEDLFTACTAHFWSGHPLPDPAAWRSIADHGVRVRRALEELYSLYESTEAMLEATGRDAHLVEAMAEPRAQFLDYLDHGRTAIVAGRPERGRARRRVEAAIGHAMSFPTWQSLVREQGLDPSEAVGVMAATVEAAGAARPRSARRA
jgi:AcrR family transcriptional regulator